MELGGMLAVSGLYPPDFTLRGHYLVLSQPIGLTTSAFT